MFFIKNSIFLFSQKHHNIRDVTKKNSIIFLYFFLIFQFFIVLRFLFTNLKIFLIIINLVRKKARYRSRTDDHRITSAVL